MSSTNDQTIKDQSVAILVSITEAPKPSYNIDGQRFSHAEYLDHLTRLIDWADRKLMEENPVEIRTNQPQP